MVEHDGNEIDTESVLVGGKQEYEILATRLVVFISDTIIMHRPTIDIAIFSEKAI